jgi:hypothetical protein
MSERSLKNIESQFPGQFGQSLDVTPSGGDIAVIAKDLVRWQGETTDVRPWRVYLGPWQPASNMSIHPDVVAMSTMFAGTTALGTGGVPWNTPPSNFSSFAGDGLSVYARANFGTAGVKHTAYVDWPLRGKLFQMSANYIQIDAVGTLALGVGTPASRLPILAATLGPEPGGGDSGSPATFTYPRQPAGTQDASPASYWFFQVPPFAREFVVLWDRATATAAPPNVTSMYITNQSARVPATPATVDQAWYFDVMGFGVGEPFPALQPLPLAPRSDVVRVKLNGPAPGLLVGMMFLLDL